MNSGATVSPSALQRGGVMAQTTVVLMCAGSFLVGGDAVVIPCDHPANPFAQSGPAIVVPRIKTLGVKSVRPDLAEEGAGSTQQQAGSAKRGAGKDQQQPASAKNSGQHHQGTSSTKGSEQQHQR